MLRQESFLSSNVVGTPLNPGRSNLPARLLVSFFLLMSRLAEA